MNSLNALEEFRIWLDPRLIGELFPLWMLYLAIAGFFMGLITAFCLWYRSARRIKDLVDQQVALRKGDIDIDGDFGDEDQKIAAFPGKPEEKEDRSKEVATVAAAGALAGAAVTMHDSEDDADNIQVTTPTESEEIRLPMALDEEPEDADDLTLLEGIDEERAAELRRAGIYKFSQIEDLSEEDRRKFGFKFGWPDINWGAWAATAAAGVGGAALLSRGATSETVESTENIQATTTIEEGTSETSTRVDERAMENETQPKVIPEDESESGIDPGKVALGAGALGAGAAAAALLGDKKEDETDTGDESIDLVADPETEEESNPAGDEAESEAGNGINPGKAAIAAGAIAAGAAGASMLGGDKEDESEEPGSLEIADEANSETGTEIEDDNLDLVTVYDDIPDDADDFTLLEGIDEEKATALREAGVYKFSQLEELDEEQREKFMKKFNWPDLDWGKWGALGATAAGAGLAGSLLGKKGEAEAVNDSTAATVTLPGAAAGAIHTGAPSNETQKVVLPGAAGETDGADWTWDYTFVEVPEETDDLTQLEGISTEDAERFKAQGIHTVKQYEELPPEKRNEVRSKFAWGDLDWSKWGTVAAAGTAVAAGVAALSGGDKDDTTGNVEPGDDSAVWDEESSKLSAGPIPAPTIPGAVTEPETGSGFSEEERTELELLQAEAEGSVASDFAGQNVKVDPELGVVYTSKPDSADDLTQLDGIDGDTAAKLNADGIYTIDQVKNLKGAQRKSFASRFGLDDIDWSKWSALSAIGAVGTAAIAKPGEAGPGKPTEPGDLHLDEPKGIFGTNDFGAASATQQRVAFIMDVSRSLTPAQLRLSKSELSSAIEALPEGSLYQVVFFSGPTWFAHQRMTEGGARGEDVIISEGEKHYKWNSGFGGFEYEEGNSKLPGGEWREATTENIMATLEDIEAVGKSYGTTWHLPLTMAMNLEPAPENIFFLTDGETARQDQVAEDMIELANQRGGGIKINTIALMVPGASVPLNRIAEGTGGEYSLVIAGGKVLKDEALREYLVEKDISLDD